MTKWISAAVLAVTVILGDAATTPSLAAAVPAGVGVQKPQATTTDLSARRRYYRHYPYRPYYPYYYGRPYYYSPGPFFLPVPQLWGYGWQWW